jgi:hypothetical protein
MRNNTVRHFYLGLLITLFWGCGSTGKSVPNLSSSSPAYTGDGGKGKSLTILMPKSSGLADSQSALPGMVLRELVSAFSSYSAIIVRNPEEMAQVYNELFSGDYDDDAEAMRDLGHLSPSEYIMTGDITKVASGYSLQFQITTTANNDKTTVAAYSDICAFRELDNLSGIKRAALDLLQKLGIQPTERTVAELSRSVTSSNIYAHAAWSKGFSAQREGNTAQTLAYYYEASSYDPSLKEAAAVANTLAVKINTGSLGENIRNDIAWRKEWQKLINEAEDYFMNNLPAMAQLVYDPALKQIRVNYDDETVDFELYSWLVPIKPPSFKMLDDLEKGLAATKRNGEWELKLPFDSDILTKLYDSGANFSTYGFYSEFSVSYQPVFEIQGESGVVLASASPKDDSEFVNAGRSPEEQREAMAEFITFGRDRKGGYNVLMWTANPKAGVQSAGRSYDPYAPQFITTAYDSYVTVLRVQADDVTNDIIVCVPPVSQKFHKGGGMMGGMLDTADTTVSGFIPVMTIDEYQTQGGKLKLKNRNVSK